MGDTAKVLLGLLLPLAGTVLGSATVFFFKKQMGAKVQKALLGFAAGVMIAASVWSLLIPAIEMAEGTLSVGKKYRGKTADCFEKFLADKLALAREESDGGVAAIYHAGIEPELFEHLRLIVVDSGIFQAVLTARAGSIISSHCGRETIGFTFQKKH